MKEAMLILSPKEVGEAVASGELKLEAILIQNYIMSLDKVDFDKLLAGFDTAAAVMLFDYVEYVFGATEKETKKRSMISKMSDTLMSDKKALLALGKH